MAVQLENFPGIISPARMSMSSATATLCQSVINLGASLICLCRYISDNGNGSSRFNILLFCIVTSVSKRFFRHVPQSYVCVLVE